jgi:plasmid stabilization system protein ParE
MGYKVLVSARAQKEIENAINFYALNSEKAPQKFISKLTDTYHTLEISPYFRVQYKKIRALKISSFPYSLFYIIDETERIVRVLSCFQNKQNPNKKPQPK